MADEPTAIRHPKGYWHRADRSGTACKRYTATRAKARLTECAPLSQTAPEDRCRTCWPTTKDVTP